MPFRDARGDSESLSCSSRRPKRVGDTVASVSGAIGALSRPARTCGPDVARTLKSHHARPALFDRTFKANPVGRRDAKSNWHGRVRQRPSSDTFGMEPVPSTPDV